MPRSSLELRRQRTTASLLRAFTLLLVGLMAVAPGLPTLAGLPAAMIGQSSNSSLPDEEDEHGPAKVKSIACAVNFFPRTRSENHTRAAAERLSGRSHARCVRQARGFDREPTDHFRNGLGAPRLC
jgi:hypothetical protein